MKIAGIDAFPFRLPARRQFHWASLLKPLGSFVYVSVTTDEGLIGIGEANPLPDWAGDHGRHGGETQGSVIDMIKRVLEPALLGLDPTRIEAAHAVMDRVLRGNNYARCAIDIALHDFWGKALGQPLHALLGGLSRERVAVAHMIGIMPTDEAVAEARRARADGITALQIKGGESATRDAATVRGIRQAIGPEVFLRLDINQGYGRAKRAMRNLAGLAGDLDMVEQPVRDLDELAALTRTLPVDVIADESCWDAHDALDLVQCHGADAISIYLAKAGGIARARRVAAIAETAGLPCDVNGSLESAIGNAANLHFALATPAVSLPCVVPVNAPAGRHVTEVAGRYYEDDVVEDGFEYRDGGLLPLDKPGLGIVVDPVKLSATVRPEWDAVSLTQALIRTEGLSGQEAEVADLVEGAMRTLGFRDVDRDDFGSVVGFVGPRRDTSAVLFDAHMDTVPVMGTWSVEPFGGTVIDGRIFGRGATDMKGALGAAICGVAEAALSGALTRQVAVSASVLEETVEGLALRPILDRTRPEQVVICEPSSLTIKHGQRGRIEVILHVTGIPAHAAYPERGRNPLLLAAEALAAIDDMDLPSREGFGRALMVPTDIISIPHPSVSSIPPAVDIRFDRRTLPGESTEAVLEALRRHLDRIDPQAFAVRISNGPVQAYTGKVTAAQRDLPPWLFDRDLPLVQAAAESVTRAGRRAEFGYYLFCTNGSETAGRRNIPTIGLGPGDEADAHTADESVSVAEVLEAAAAYRNLSLTLAGAQP